MSTLDILSHTARSFGSVRGRDERKASDIHVRSADSLSQRSLKSWNGIRLNKKARLPRQPPQRLWNRQTLRHNCGYHGDLTHEPIKCRSRVPLDPRGRWWKARRLQDQQ